MAATNHNLSVSAVMFDLDGTLIDSAPIYYQIIDVVFANLGVPSVPKKTLQEAMDDGDFDWDYVLPDHMQNRKTELIDTAREIIDDIAPTLFRKQNKLIDGTVETLKQIAAKDLRMGIVTSTPMEYLKIKMTPLEKAGIDKLMEIVITADDVVEKKPAAEPLVKGSERLGVPLNKCAYVGDTRVDIRAGKAAGMKTVGVLTGFDDYDALNNEKPDAIIESIAQLNETLCL